MLWSKNPELSAKWWFYRFGLVVSKWKFLVIHFQLVYIHGIHRAATKCFYSTFRTSSKAKQGFFESTRRLHTSEIPNWKFFETNGFVPIKIEVFHGIFQFIIIKLDTQGCYKWLELLITDGSVAIFVIFIELFSYRTKLLTIVFFMAPNNTIKNLLCNDFWCVFLWNVIIIHMFVDFLNTFLKLIFREMPFNTISIIFDNSTDRSDEISFDKFK